MPFGSLFTSLLLESGDRNFSLMPFPAGSFVLGASLGTIPVEDRFGTLTDFLII